MCQAHLRVVISYTHQLVTLKQIRKLVIRWLQINISWLRFSSSYQYQLNSRPKGIHVHDIFSTPLLLLWSLFVRRPSGFCSAYYSWNCSWNSHETSHMYWSWSLFDYKWNSQWLKKQDGQQAGILKFCYFGLAHQNYKDNSTEKHFHQIAPYQIPLL